GVPPVGPAPIRTRRRRSAVEAEGSGVGKEARPVSSAGVSEVVVARAVSALGSALPGTWALDDAARTWSSRPRWRLGYTATLSALAVLFWGGLVGLIYAVDPEVPAGRTGFFVLLGGALFCTLAPLLRLIALQFSHSRVFQEAVSWHAARQATLLTVFVLLNAFLQMERAWSGIAALLLFCVFAVIEIVAQARR
ncbi:MAG TPA: hypothetical protein VGW38_15095, partial [Chloroflexota bacterium]|nr:hypothetical protein [Chloroflexota bacterium]